MKFTKTMPETTGWWYWKGIESGAIWLLNVYYNKRGVLMAEWIEDHKRGSSPVAELSGSYWSKANDVKSRPCCP